MSSVCSGLTVNISEMNIRRKIKSSEGYSYCSSIKIVFKFFMRTNKYKPFFISQCFYLIKQVLENATIAKLIQHLHLTVTTFITSMQTHLF